MAPQREWFEKDYYKVLGVSDTATDKEIGKAYRKLAKQYHPDANPGSEDRFKEISAAYDVLGDPAKRKEYDEVRRSGPAGNPFAGMGGRSADPEARRRLPGRRPRRPARQHLRPGQPARPGRRDAHRRHHGGPARPGPRDQPAPVVPRRRQRHHHHRQPHLRGAVPHLRRVRRGARAPSPRSARSAAAGA